MGCASFSFSEVLACLMARAFSSSATCVAMQSLLLLQFLVATVVVELIDLFSTSTVVATEVVVVVMSCVAISPVDVPPRVSSPALVVAEANDL